MNRLFSKVRKGISASFQFITLVLLVIAIALLIKQQNDMLNLEKRVNSIYSNIDDVNSKIEDVESNINSKLENVESNISSEVDDVKRAVIIWSN